LQAASYNGSVWQRIALLGTGTESLALKTGPSGIVVGRSTITAPITDTDVVVPPVEHAFSYDGTLVSDLGTLGGPDSRAYGVNGQGDVVGSSSTTSDDSSEKHAFLYTPADGMTDLGTLTDGAESSAVAVNSHRQAVGSALTSEEVN